MTAILNTQNKPYYLLIYQKYKYIPIDPLKSYTYSPDLENTIQFNNIPHFKIPISNINQTNFFVDGAPYHIITTQDPKIATKFKSLTQALDSLYEKFQMTFHEGIYHETQINNNTIEYILYSKNSNEKIISAFQLYNPINP